MRPQTLVTALTLSRFPFVALGYWAAFQGDALATITFGCVAVATDMGDGILARRWGVTSEWGSNLDSIADFTFYTGVLVWAYQFAPELTQHNGLAIGYFSAYVIMLLAGWLLRGTIAVHDRFSRATGTAGGLGGLWIIGVGYSQWIIVVVALFATADLAHRLHATVRALARRKKGLGSNRSV